jgi:arsenate reductase (thioredoxin)
LKRVLFVCIGNVCRSPMAEGFANHYGSDVLIATSAGVSPLKVAVQETIAIMREVNVDISNHTPAWYEAPKVDQYDLVVNMSGFRLPGKAPRELIEWTVEDPYQKPPAVYRRVRADLENKVMQLILKLRQKNR